jgi:uncharacterized membrane protein SirB2
MSRKTRLTLALSGIVFVLVTQFAVVYTVPSWSFAAMLSGIVINAALGVWALWRPQRTPQRNR